MEFNKLRLDEICSVITDGSHSSPKSVENGYPMASVKDMTYSGLDLNSCRKVSKEDYEALIKNGCKPQINDVLIAKDGSYLKHISVVKKNEEVVLLSSIAILRPDLSIINPDFLKYYLLNPVIKDELEIGYVSGSVIRRIVLKDFRKFEVNIPNLETQEKIASILSALDDKIEINNEMNKTLEEMAQTLFKRWFIDFDFPNENGEPYRSSGGKMVDSELGEIPEGWEVKELKFFGETITGKTPSTIKKEYFGKDIPFIKTPDMHGNIFICEYENYLSNLGAESQYKKYVPENTVLMSCIGAKAGVVSLTTEKSQFNQQINGFIATNSYDAFYFYFALNLQKDNLRLKGSSGSTMININKNSFETHKYFYGDKNTMQNISKLFKPIFEKIKQNMIENNILKNKRDTLLPKLMSGEIEV